ncbi:MAG: peptidoglycan recognition family protein [Planctomycetota bacterium]|nr:peptidoglycan recognition family protein [Planctomycetota bacterium]
MRAVFDFLHGIASGLHRNSARSYTGARAVKASCAEARSRGGHARPAQGGLGRSIGQFCALVLGLACGAAALLAATGLPRPRARATEQCETPAAEPSVPAQDFAEVLATDPTVPARAWKYIVMHHSATAGGSAQSFDRNHRERGWRCLAYHFVIGNGNGQGDGEIIAGPRWYSQAAGAHANANEYNEYGIGICLVGNLDDQPPTPAQWAVTRALVARLRALYNVAGTDVVGHNQIRNGGSTACPGKLMPLAELREGP